MSDEMLGPIDYLAVEFSAGRITDEDFSILSAAVEHREVRVLDLEFVCKDADGNVRRVALDELDNPGGIDLSVWEGAYSGLLDRSDVAEIGTVLQAGSVAAIVIYENLWTLALDEQLHGHGARLIADGRLDPDEVLAALDRTDNDVMGA